MSKTTLSQRAMETQNESEKLFEQYLDSNGFRGKWIHEPQIPRKSKRPDYLLNYNGQEYFFEVKELRKKDNEPTKWPAYIDPYTSLRTEINEARKQFKQFKDYSCSLVVYNIDDRQARLRPNYVLGAMLGNLGIEMDFNAAEGKLVEGTEENVFLNGGKMIDDKMGRTQNKTISAIVVLEEFRDDSEIQKAIKEEVKKQGKLPTLVEKVEINIKVVKNHHSSLVSRVVVVENPFARIAFPEGLFFGPFDERWRWTMENGKFERVFAGDKFRELEELRDKS
jgi:hypothetical protein